MTPLPREAPLKSEEPLIKRIGFGFRNFENYRIRAVRGQFPLRSFGHQKYAPLAVIPDST